MPTFKTFYVVVAGNNRWGRGTTRDAALNAAGLTTALSRKNIEHFVYIGVVAPQATDAELDNLCQCWNVSDFGGVTLYDNPSEEDQKQVNELLIGWVSEHSYKGKWVKGDKPTG